MKRDRAATRALVLGFLSWPFGVLAPFAIWSGARSLRRIRSSGGALRGESSARLGLLAGIVGFAAFIVGTAYWLLA